MIKMKKSVFFVAALAAFVFISSKLNAQDFKPAAGDKNIEVNFTPFGNGNPIEINNIRFRYFIDPDFALRIGLHVFSNSTDDPDGVTDPALEIQNIVGLNVNSYELKEFEFGINFGFEKHWQGTDRLSPYWGLEAGFLTYSYTETVEFDDGAGGTVDGEVSSGETAIGLNAVLGVDYYFAKKFYLGTEVGFGFVSTTSADLESEFGGTSTTFKGPSNTEIGESVNGAIRIGFIF
jgi:hypothetical protein